MKAAKRGRPVEIDRSEAALRAAGVFWRHGYEASSIDLLVAATNVSRPGLYRTFDGKEDLFLAAVDAYEARVTHEAITAFEAQADIGAAVEAFLTTSARNNTQDGGPRGCLIACCAVTSAADNLSIRLKVMASFEALEARLAQRFALEEEGGVLSRLPPPLSRAKLLLDFMTAQAVRARSGESYEALIHEIALKRDAVLASDVHVRQGKDGQT
ncbi:TetR/AcrR family transcriptional regulator [Blastomonas sp. UPD001]|uniref:TetR/AcrR family transcriptional regulator n=1 Tax=Blastomonas sp. UPD001 TaxID=2217673 RepID=UPI0013009017|nr:TetR/AcrR family transcriptional regulator [Blastomonas sp. UPD001]